MKRLTSHIAPEFRSMRRWNWLQWLLFVAIVGIVALFVSASWCFPQGRAYQTDEWVERYDRQGGWAWETEPSPESNPAWVRFIQDNDGLTLFALFTCVGLGAWITKISGRRHDKLLSDAYDELASCDQEEDFVGWYYVWREEGLSDDDLINCFTGKPVPPALKRELERQGKQIVVDTKPPD